MQKLDHASTVHPAPAISSKRYLARLALIAAGLGGLLLGALVAPAGTRAEGCVIVQQCLPNHLPAGLTPTPTLKPQPLVIPATRFDTSYSVYTHASQNVYCNIPNPLQGLSTTGTGGDLGIGPPPPEIGVGYMHAYDPGQDPFPCDFTDNVFYRGAVQFQMNQVNKFVQGHGLAKATFSYSVDSGYPGCVSEIDITSANPWRDPNNPDEVAGGGIKLTAPQDANNGSFSVDITAWIAVEAVPGSSGSPNMHFVFIGSNEDQTVQDNKSCETVLGNFQLTLVAEH
jgi:hypothetical protein